MTEYGNVKREDSKWIDTPLGWKEKKRKMNDFLRYVTEHTLVTKSFSRRDVRRMDAIVALLRTGDEGQASQALQGLLSFPIDAFTGDWIPTTFLTECVVHYFLAMDPLRLGAFSAHDGTTWMVYHSLRCLGVLTQCAPVARDVSRHADSSLVVQYLAMYASTACPSIEWSLHAMRVLRALAPMFDTFHDKGAVRHAVSVLVDIVESPRHICVTDAMDCLVMYLGVCRVVDRSLPVSSLVHHIVQWVTEETEIQSPLVGSAMALLVMLSRVECVVEPSAGKARNICTLSVLCRILERDLQIVQKLLITVEMCFLLLSIQSDFAKNHSVVVVDLVSRVRHVISPHVVSKVLRAVC